jgi:hypothetical protein
MSIVDGLVNDESAWKNLFITDPDCVLWHPSPHWQWVDFCLPELVLLLPGKSR